MTFPVRFQVTANILKRSFDLFLAFAGLSVAAPIMLTIAVAVKATSSGPVIFRQARVGLHGKVFEIYKFRTMLNRAEELGTSVTTVNDPRITPVGRMLRRFKLDELPQLFNVLKGEMSLVGPRPDVSEIVCGYTQEMRRIFQILPGITSVATLHLRDEEAILAAVPDPDAFYEKVLIPLKIRLAMEHVNRDSFAFDLKILCQTVWMLTLGRWWPVKENPAVSNLKQEIVANHICTPS